MKISLHPKFLTYVGLRPDWYTPSEKDGNHPPLRQFWTGLGKTPSYFFGVEKGLELHSHFAAKHSKLTITFYHILLTNTILSCRNLNVSHAC